MNDLSTVPAFIYLDEQRIDEVWVTIKHEGIPESTVKEVEVKASAKATFGLGNLLKTLIADLRGEVSGEIGGKRTVTTQTVAALKLLMIQELLPSIHHLFGKGPQEFRSRTSNVRLGDFAVADLPDLKLTPLPTFADFLVLSGEGENSNDQQMLKEFREVSRAITFMIDSEERKSALHEIHERYEELIMDALRRSRNDQTIGVSRIGSRTEDPIYFVVACDEIKLRSRTMIFAGTQPVSVFGQIVAHRIRQKTFFSGYHMAEETKREVFGTGNFDLFGIDPIAISLTPLRFGAENFG